MTVVSVIHTGATVPEVLIIAAGFTFFACFISAVLIYEHLRHYTRAAEQRWIVRVLFMVPIYSVDSFLSLVEFADNTSIYIDTVRDCYEAYTIYCFFQLMVAYLGGREGVEASLNARSHTYHFTPLCCLRIRLARSNFFIRVRRAVMQFVIIKVALAVAVVVLTATHTLRPDAHKPRDLIRSGYFYVKAFGGLSVAIAMYGLLLFYSALRDELRPHSPGGKLICIKIVIAFTFFQGWALSILVTVGVIGATDGKTTFEIVSGIQDFLVCIYMFMIAVAHQWVFSGDPYKTENAVIDAPDYRRYVSRTRFEFEDDDQRPVVGKAQSSHTDFLPSLRDALAVQDVVHEAVDVFGIRRGGNGNTTGNGNGDGNAAATRPSNETANERTPLV